MSNVSNEYNEALLEPLKYYREELKDTFQQVTEEYFQQLVDQSKVDIDNNKVLIDKYTDVSENRDQSGRTTRIPFIADQETKEKAKGLFF